MSDVSQETILKNKELCERYPFLHPRNAWIGERLPNFDYSFTEADEVPDGWRKAFGDEMWEELRELLIKYNYLDDFYFGQIKEKYGTLRLYYGSCTEALEKDLAKWERKYEVKSMQYCIHCGKPTKYLTSGWTNYICEDCANEIECQKYKLTEKDIPIMTYKDPETNEYVEVTWPEADELFKQWS